MFWWLKYCWYFEALSILIADVLLAFSDTKYFYGGLTVDTLRSKYIDCGRTADILIYLVLWRLTFCWYFGTLNIFMVDLLLILWDTKYIDCGGTADILIYLVLWRLTFCWYFGTLNIFMVDALLILWDVKYFYGGRTVDTLDH